MADGADSQPCARSGSVEIFPLSFADCKFNTQGDELPMKGLESKLGALLNPAPLDFKDTVAGRPEWHALSGSTLQYIQPDLLQSKPVNIPLTVSQWNLHV